MAVSVYSGLRESDVQLLRELFSALPEVERAWVVGSRAEGGARAGSDLDLVVAGVPERDLWKVREAIEESRLIYEFDLLSQDDWARLSGEPVPASVPLYRRG